MKIDTKLVAQWMCDYTESDLRMDTISYIAQRAADHALEESAKVCKPKNKRPCDCTHCDCGNSGDKQAVDQWDEANAMYEAIRAMKGTK